MRRLGEEVFKVARDAALSRWAVLVVLPATRRRRSLRAIKELSAVVSTPGWVSTVAGEAATISVVVVVRGMVPVDMAMVLEDEAMGMVTAGIMAMVMLMVVMDRVATVMGKVALSSEVCVVALVTVAMAVEVVGGMQRWCPPRFLRRRPLFQRR